MFLTYALIIPKTIPLDLPNIFGLQSQTISHLWSCVICLSCCFENVHNKMLISRTVLWLQMLSSDPLCWPVLLLMGGVFKKKFKQIKREGESKTSKLQPFQDFLFIFILSLYLGRLSQLQKITNETFPIRSNLRRGERNAYWCAKPTAFPFLPYCPYAFWFVIL